MGSWQIILFANCQLPFANYSFLNNLQIYILNQFFNQIKLLSSLKIEGLYNSLHIIIRFKGDNDFSFAVIVLL